MFSVSELVTDIKLNRKKKNVSPVSVVSLYCNTRTYLCPDEHSKRGHPFCNLISFDI